MKNTYKDPIETIHHSISTGDCDALSDALDQIYSTGRRSAEAKTAVCFGYKALAKHLGQGDPVNALQAHDRARQMFPGDKGLLQSEMSFLKEFLEKNRKELTETDFDTVQIIIKIIKALIPKSKTKMAGQICEPFEQNKYKTGQTKETSTNASVQLKEMGNCLHLNLKPEQRKALVKELAPYLPALIKSAEKMGLFDELRKKKKKHKKS